MNICFFAGNIGNAGGTEHMTQLLANELSKENEYKVFVLSKSLKNKKEFFPLSKDVNLDVLDSGIYKGITTLVKDIFFLRKYIKRNKIDVLINVDVTLGTFSLPLKILCPKLKQIFWEHFSFHYNLNSNRTVKLRKLALKAASAYVTLTPDDTKQFKELVKQPCLVCDIPNINAVNECEKAYDINSKKIVSIGHFLVVKGFDIAISVAKQVFEKHPDWSWELYGDGIERDALCRLVKENKLENNFIFKGRTSDLACIYQDASMLVMTSRSEGFGLVLIEAQAYHLPTVAFDVPYGPRNIIKDNVNGYLIEPFDVDTMASKICELIESVELRKKFSENAENDLSKYSKDNVASLWKKLLGEI